MGGTQEPGGDYGYDLAHQDVPVHSGNRPAGADPAAVGEQGPAATSGAAPSGADTSGDYAYDEAHDF